MMIGKPLVLYCLLIPEYVCIRGSLFRQSLTISLTELKFYLIISFFQSLHYDNWSTICPVMSYSISMQLEYTTFSGFSFSKK